MRNRVFWNSPHTRLFSCLTLLGLMALAFAGCGGGGGTHTTTTTTSNVSITGTVVDNSTANAPVVNALVSIVNTSLSTHTDAKGNYSFASVPITATAFTVSNPNTALYFSYANFGAQTYDIINCTLPLPTLHTGTNTVGEVELLVSSSAPPPVPVGGCP